MNDNESLTWIDQLATETILDIFQYLSSNDIIYAFYGFNQRFISILLYYQQYLNNLKSPTTNIYHWQNIFTDIGSYIHQLILTTNDTYFSLDLFPNLQSLIISSTFPIDYSLLDSIFQAKQFNKLNSFKIQCEIFYRDNNYKSLENNIFTNENSLETFECLSIFNSYDSNIIYNGQINEKITSLSMKFNEFISGVTLLQYTPNLKSYRLAVSWFNLSTDTIDLSNIKLEKFFFTCEENYVHFKIDERSLGILTDFIKQFSSSLISLSIDLSENNIYETRNTFELNGLFLQRQLLQPMIKLKEFNLYVKLNQRPKNVEHFLLTFRSEFWLEHNWSIGIHGNYFYTLPFHFDKLLSFIDFDSIELSNPMICHSPETWSYVTSIALICECHELSLHLIKQLKMNTINLKSITLNSVSPYRSKSITRILDNDVKLDSVTTVFFRSNCTDDFQKWFTNILPNLEYLILPMTHDLNPIVYEKIRRLKIPYVKSIQTWKNSIQLYFPHVEYIEIELFPCCLDDIIKILQNLQNTKIIMFYFLSYKYSNINPSVIDVTEMISKSYSIEVLEYYHIKYDYNCLQLIKKK